MSAKRILDEKLDDVNMKNPVRSDMKKIDLVGLPYAVSKEEAMAAFVSDNSSLGLSISAEDPCVAEVQNNSDLLISIMTLKSAKIQSDAAFGFELLRL